MDWNNPMTSTLQTKQKYKYEFAFPYFVLVAVNWIHTHKLDIINILITNTSVKVHLRHLTNCPPNYVIEWPDICIIHLTYGVVMQIVLYIHVIHK